MKNGYRRERSWQEARLCFPQLVVAACLIPWLSYFPFLWFYSVAMCHIGSCTHGSVRPSAVCSKSSRHSVSGRWRGAFGYLSEHTLVDEGSEVCLDPCHGWLNSVLSIITWGIIDGSVVFLRVVIHFNNIHPLQYMATKAMACLVEFFAVDSTTR
jgi:hypothetical protein